MHKKQKITDKRIATRQSKQFDKVFKENIRQALPGFLRHLLGIQAAQMQMLPAALQHTKEREADALVEITDEAGALFILHLEFQSTNDADIAWRMAEYRIMVERKYRRHVKQYVVYIGRDKMTLPYELRKEGLLVEYKVVDISQVQYTRFLQPDSTLEEKVFAILANFGDDAAKTAVVKILAALAQSPVGELEKSKAGNQLLVLAQLRNLAEINIEEVMESIPTFFKKENDLLYMWGEQRGMEKGMEKGDAKFVKYLLEHTEYSIEKIAEEAGVSVEFVKKVKATL